MDFGKGIKMNIPPNITQNDSWDSSSSDEIQDGQIIEISESSDVEEDEQASSTEIKVSFVSLEKIQQGIIHSPPLSIFKIPEVNIAKNK